jgi:hypothetical protein
VVQKTVVPIALLLCFVEFATAQSLTEMAKKEKQRRKANAEAGQKAVVEAEGAGGPLTEEEKRAKEEREEKEAEVQQEKETAKLEAAEEKKQEHEKNREAAKEREEQADEYEADLKSIGRDCRAAGRDCYSRDQEGLHISDRNACADMAELQSEYATVYQKLWSLDPKRAIFLPSGCP